MPELFPEPPQQRPASSLRLAVRAAAFVIALAAGAVVLLLRIAGPSPLTTIWAEDRTVFLVQALASPRHLFASYAAICSCCRGLSRNASPSCRCATRRPHSPLPAR